MEFSDTLPLIQALTYLVGILAILWGLAQMQQAGRRRDREIDVMTETLRESTTQLGRALERQGEALTELLRRSA